MSLKTRLFTGLTAVVAAGAFAVTGSAQTAPETKTDEGKKMERHEGRRFRHDGMQRGKGRGMRRGGFRMGGLRGIELTEEQKTAIKAIRIANKPDEAVRAELKAIKEARRAGTITPEQTERRKALREQAKARHEAVRLQIENLLTPEQRQQIETRKQEMQKHREERRLLRQQKRTEGEKPAAS